MALTALRFTGCTTAPFQASCWRSIEGRGHLSSRQIELATDGQDVYSSESQDFDIAVFVLLAVLPAGPAELPSSRSVILNSVPPFGVAPTILVVEDDRAIRYLLTHVLEAMGYLVIACEDGAHGLAVASAEIHRIDAVITDSTMPGMEGRELLGRIRALRAELPVLVVSGTIDDGTMRAIEDPFTIRLSKPVSPDRLRLELRRLLSLQAEGGSSQPSVR